MKDEIKLAKIFIEDINGYLDARIYIDENGKPEAYTPPIDRNDPSSYTSTLGNTGDISSLLARHASAVRTQISITKKKKENSYYDRFNSSSK